MPTSFFNSAFFNGEFFFGAIPPVFVRDTHDGKKKRRKFEEIRLAKEELQRQLREGLFGVEKPTLFEADSKTLLQTREKVYIADHEMASKLRHYEELMADDEDAITILLLH